MNVLHILGRTDGLPGPPALASRLCEAMATHGLAVHLSYVGAPGVLPGVQVNAHRAVALHRLAFSPAQVRQLSQQLHTADVVHVHHLWSLAAIAAGWMTPSSRARLVLSPHGSLAPHALRFSRTTKRLAWPLQKRVLHHADLIVASSDQERRDVEALGARAPIVVIPNGLDVPTSVQRTRAATRELLFFGRVHPIKGIAELLCAWSALSSKHPDWHLSIVGPGRSNDLKNAQTLALTLGLRHVSFLGPQYGDSKTTTLSNADLFVLPSHSDAFPAAVGEALAHGCPVVVSHATPWGEVERRNCGWNTAVDVASLTRTLDRAMSTSRDELLEMGARGRVWVAESYQWSDIARRTAASYQWIRDGGPQPPDMNASSAS